MSKLGKKEPRMDTDEHGCDFLEKLLDGAEVEWVALGEVATFLKGKSLPKKSIVEEGVHKCIHYGELFTYYPAIIKDVKSRTSQSITDSIVSLSNDVLMPTSDVTPTGLAVASCIREDNIVLGGDILVIRSSAIDGRFLSTFIRNNKSKIMQMVKGATVYHIYAKDLAKLSIPIPCPENPEKSLAIQAEIVRILDTFTELTTELTAELTARKKQYNYYRDQLLTFEEGDLEWKTLGELAKNLDSKRKPITAGSREPGEIPYYGASGIVDYVKGFIFDGDYLLVSEDGANLLARSTPIAFSIHGKTWVNNHAHVLEFETYAERKYIEYYLSNIDLTPYISGAAQPKLNKKNLNSIRIPNPSIEEKKRTVAILDKFDTLTHSISEGLPREIELRQKQYEYYRDLLLNFPKPEPQTEIVA